MAKKENYKKSFTSTQKFLDNRKAANSSPERKLAQLNYRIDALQQKQIERRASVEDIQELTRLLNESGKTLQVQSVEVGSGKGNYYIPAK